MTKFCALCNTELSGKNNSKEHTIPQSIGGRLIVQSFICKKCNEQTGQDWDASLCKQLSEFSNYFNISRERGDVPSCIVSTTKGESFERHADGHFSVAKPLYRKKQTEKGIEVEFSARSDKEMGEFLDKLKQHYPFLNIDEIEKSIIYKSEYPEGSIHYKFSFGSEPEWRSVVKTAFSFAYYSGIPIASCDKALDYLKNDTVKPYGFYSQNIILNRPQGVPLHCVTIWGNPVTKLLMAYVEYFGFLRLLICLSDSYVLTDSFFSFYAINPKTGMQITDLKFNFSFQKEDLSSLYNHEFRSDELISNAMDEIVSHRQQEMTNDERSRVVSTALDKVFKKYGITDDSQLDQLNDEQRKSMSREFEEEMKPWMEHFLGKRWKKSH